MLSRRKINFSIFALTALCFLLNVASCNNTSINDTGSTTLWISPNSNETLEISLINIKNISSDSDLIVAGISASFIQEITIDIQSSPPFSNTIECNGLSAAFCVIPYKSIFSLSTIIAIVTCKTAIEEYCLLKMEVYYTPQESDIMVNSQDDNSTYFFVTLNNNKQTEVIALNLPAISAEGFLFIESASYDNSRFHLLAFLDSQTKNLNFSNPDYFGLPSFQSNSLVKIPTSNIKNKKMHIVILTSANSESFVFGKIYVEHYPRNIDFDVVDVVSSINCNNYIYHIPENVQKNTSLTIKLISYCGDPYISILSETLGKLLSNHSLSESILLSPNQIEEIIENDRSNLKISICTLDEEILSSYLLNFDFTDKISLLNEIPLSLLLDQRSQLYIYAQILPSKMYTLTIFNKNLALLTNVWYCYAKQKCEKILDSTNVLATFGPDLQEQTLDFTSPEDGNIILIIYLQNINKKPAKAICLLTEKNNEIQLPLNIPITYHFDVNETAIFTYPILLNSNNTERELLIDTIFGNNQIMIFQNMYKENEDPQKYVLYQDLGLTYPKYTRNLKFSSLDFVEGLLYIEIFMSSASTFTIEAHFFEKYTFDDDVIEEIIENEDSEIYGSDDFPTEYNATDLHQETPAFVFSASMIPEELLYFDLITNEMEEKKYVIQLDNGTSVVHINFNQISGISEVFISLDGEPSVTHFNYSIKNNWNTLDIHFDADKPNPKYICLLVVPLITPIFQFEDAIYALSYSVNDINHIYLMDSIPFSGFLGYYKEVVFRYYIPPGIEQIIFEIKNDTDIDVCYYFNKQKHTQDCMLIDIDPNMSGEIFQAVPKSTMQKQCDNFEKEGCYLLIKMSNTKNPEAIYNIIAYSSNILYISDYEPIFIQAPYPQQSLFLIHETSNKKAFRLQIKCDLEYLELSYFVTNSSFDLGSVDLSKFSYSKTKNIGQQYDIFVSENDLKICEGIICRIIFCIANIEKSDSSSNLNYMLEAQISSYDVLNLMYDYTYYIEYIPPMSFNYFNLEVQKNDCEPKIIVLPLQGGKVDLFINKGFGNFTTKNFIAEYLSTKSDGDFIELNKTKSIYNFDIYSISVYNPGAVSGNYLITAVCQNNENYVQEIEIQKNVIFPIKKDKINYFKFVNFANNLSSILIRLALDYDIECTAYINIYNPSLNASNNNKLIEALLPKESQYNFKKTFYNSDLFSQNWITIYKDVDLDPDLDQGNVYFLGVKPKEDSFLSIFVKFSGFIVDLYNGVMIVDHYLENEPSYYTLLNIGNMNNDASNITSLRIVLEIANPLQNFDELKILMSPDELFNTTTLISYDYFIFFNETSTTLVDVFLPNINIATLFFQIVLPKTTMFSLLVETQKSQDLIHVGNQIRFALRKGEFSSFMLMQSSYENTDYYLSLSYAFKDNLQSITKDPVSVEIYYVNERLKTKIADKQNLHVVLMNTILIQFSHIPDASYYIVITNNDKKYPVDISFVVTGFNAINYINLPYNTSKVSMLPANATDIYEFYTEEASSISLDISICFGNLKITHSRNVGDIISKNVNFLTITEKTHYKITTFAKSPVYFAVKQDNDIVNLNDDKIHNFLSSNLIYTLFSVLNKNQNSDTITTVQPKTAGIFVDNNQDSILVTTSLLNYSNDQMKSCIEKEQTISAIVSTNSEVAEFIMNCPNYGNYLNELDNITKNELNYTFINNTKCDTSNCIIKIPKETTDKYLGVRTEVHFDDDCFTNSLAHQYKLIIVQSIESENTSNNSYLYVFMCVSLLIVVIGCMLGCYYYLKYKKTEIKLNYELADVGLSFNNQLSFLSS